MEKEEVIWREDKKEAKYLPTTDFYIKFRYPLNLIIAL